MYLFMGVCFSISSVALFVGAVWAIFRGRRQAHDRFPASGTVVELVSRISASGRSNIIVPVVEFSLPDGRKFRFTSDFGSMPARHRLGQVVDIKYDPGDPQKAEIDSPANIWLMPAILLFMGLVACCLGLGFLAIYSMFPDAFSAQVMRLL